MGKYSIKDLEELSGIKAHTIRIWEKRYNLIEPERTLTNIRYYSDEDLKKLLNVSMLNRHGLKISRPTVFEPSNTKVVASPMPSPLKAEVVTPKAGHSPSKRI